MKMLMVFISGMELAFAINYAAQGRWGYAALAFCLFVPLLFRANRARP